MRKRHNPDAVIAMTRDIPRVSLQELFGGLLTAAVKLLGERRLGLEETAAATTALFLDGARLPEPTRAGTDEQS